MKVADAVAVAGHEVHVCRYREARTLLRWLGADLRGLRVLAPGGELVMSADALTLAERWPRLYRAHCERYRVKRTYSHDELAALLSARGLAVVAHQYQFRTRWAQQLYLGLSAYGGRIGFNAAAPVTPLVAAADRGGHGDGGAIVLVRARCPAGLRPGRAEVFAGDSAQGVGFIIDGTSTKACRAVRLTRALRSKPARVAQERSKCGRGTSRTS